MFHRHFYFVFISGYCNFFYFHTVCFSSFSFFFHNTVPCAKSRKLCTTNPLCYHTKPTTVQQLTSSLIVGVQGLVEGYKSKIVFNNLHESPDQKTECRPITLVIFFFQASFITAKVHVTDMISLMFIQQFSCELRFWNDCPETNTKLIMLTMQSQWEQTVQWTHQNSRQLYLLTYPGCRKKLIVCTRCNWFWFWFCFSWVAKLTQDFKANQ